MTIRPVPGFLVIILMIEFSRPEIGGFLHAGHDIIPATSELINQSFRDFFLMLVMVKNRRSILVTDIGPLTVHLCRIMNFEKKPG